MLGAVWIPQYLNRVIQRLSFCSQIDIYSPAFHFQKWAYLFDVMIKMKPVITRTTVAVKTPIKRNGYFLLFSGFWGSWTVSKHITLLIEFNKSFWCTCKEILELSCVSVIEWHGNKWNNSGLKINILSLLSLRKIYIYVWITHE